MLRPVNYELFRIRLEFLYRMLNLSNVIMTNVLRLTPNEVEQVVSIIASSGLQVAYLYRVDGMLVESHAEKVNAQGVAQVIADEFMNLSQRISAECDGLPITITGVRYECLLQEGLDNIMEILKGLMEARKEYDNG